MFKYNITVNDISSPINVIPLMYYSKVPKYILQHMALPKEDVQ